VVLILTVTTNKIMALSNEEKQIIEFGKANGKSPLEVKTAIAKYRSQGVSTTATSTITEPSVQDRLADVGNQTAQTISDNLTGSGQFAGQSPLRRGVQATAAGFSAVPRGALAMAPEPVRKGIDYVTGKVGQGFNALTKSIGNTKFMQEAAGREYIDPNTGISTYTPNDLGLLGEGLGIAASGGEIAGTIVGAKGTATTISGASNLATKVVGGITIPDIKVGDPLSIFKRQPSSVEDAIKQADESIKMSQATNVTTNVNLQNQINNQVNVNVPETKIDLDSVNKRLDTLIEQGKITEARALAEATAPKLSVAEKWAGIRPDIKNRIQGKSELMREYFDVTHARNSNDRVPGVQEYAASYAQEAVNVMETQLRETGGDIGRIREKLGTIQAPRPQVEKINTTWQKQLDSLNLREVNGQIVQKPGTQSRLQASGDLKVINDLNNELRILNQNPSLTNIIDFRTNLDGRINFAKSSREASNSVDGLSRSMRTQLAESANTIVGKSGAADVQKYSEFMTALNDLKSFTDRKAGAEYMLKLVLSGRGREARQIMDTVKEQTGIDLLDHATMMQISTELIANEAQKNLFRQELTKSGLDAARLLGGDATGAVATIFEKSFEKVMDTEKIFLKAAE
jgi:hypothetical protein